MHTFDCRTILEHSTRAIVLVVWLLNSWGCAFIRGNVGDEINEASVANLKKGTTTRGEVAAMGLKSNRTRLQARKRSEKSRAAISRRFSKRGLAWVTFRRTAPRSAHPS